ncbi:MAG TPA: hypothetical protein VIG97_14645 [Luteimonas sp.]
MRTDLWGAFSGLVGPAPRILATVTAHNADGTSSLATYEGVTMRAQGQVGEAPPYNVWVQEGRIVGLAPNLPLVTGVV